MSMYRVLWAAVGLLLANTARADDGGSAAACGPWSYLDADILNFDPRGVLNHSATDYGAMTCGFVRQSSASPELVYIDYRNNSTLQLSCTVRMISWTGADLWTSTMRSTTTGYGLFYFTIPTSTIGYGSVNCTLPPYRTGDIGPSMVYGFSVE